MAYDLGDAWWCSVRLLSLVSPLHGVAALVMTALATLILVLDARSPVHRAFAVFLGIRAVVNFGSAFGLSLIAGIDPYLGVLLPFVALHFAIVYHRRMRRSHGRAWTVPLLWGYGLLGVLALREHHQWLWGPIGVFGPFQFWMFAARMIVYAAIGLLLAWDATRSPADAHQRSLLVVSMGFVLNPLFVSVGALAHLFDEARRFGFLATPSGVTWLAVLPCLAALVLLQIAGRRAAEPSFRRGTRVWGLAFLACAALAVLTVVVSGYSVSHPTYIVMDGAMTLAFPLLVAYALLKHRLFDIDLAIKWSIRRGTVASAFVGAFFLAQEGAEYVIASRTGSTLVGIAGAAALVAVVKPLGRLGARISDAAMPAVQETPEYERARKLEVYEEAVDSLLDDGKLSAKEEEALARMRRRLGLDEAEAREAERRVREARSALSAS